MIRDESEQPAALLEVRRLQVAFTSRDRVVYAVRGVDLRVGVGDTLGIVGESGCGKSTLLRALIGLHDPRTTVCDGSIRYEGEEMLAPSGAATRGIRGRKAAMIFQDPMSYLNPVLTVAEQIGETLQRHTTLRRRDRRARILELLSLVGMSAPGRRMRQYPHELSGGMRQRVMIAIALACEPRVLLADEPTTALDVSIQAQILELIADLRSRLGMTLVLVSHDLGVVAHTCDRVMVMYAGQVVEAGSTAQVIAAPQHPYTAGLLRSLPGRANSRRYLHPIPGLPPRLEERSRTCSFRPRCEVATTACETWETELLAVTASRTTRCINHDAVQIID